MRFINESDQSKNPEMNFLKGMIDGDITHFKDEVKYVTTSNISISTGCKDPVTLVMYIYYWYSRDSGMFANFGVNGVVCYRFRR